MKGISKFDWVGSVERPFSPLKEALVFDGLPLPAVAVGSGVRAKSYVSKEWFGRELAKFKKMLDEIA